MTKKQALRALILIVLCVFGWIAFRQIMLQAEPKEAGRETHDESVEYYTCPMHPTVRSDRPGACPVCGMALVKRSSQMGDVPDISNLGAVMLSPTQRVMANVTTAVVERKNLKKEISALGVVDFAEPNYLHISMRFPGRLEKLYLNYTGQTVHKGDPVADVYSPEAISAQQEYLLALDSFEQLKSTSTGMSANAHDLLNEAEQKLLRWGFTEQQVSKLKISREVNRLVTIYSPISGTVMKKNIDPQHYAAMGEDIYDIADLSTVWIYLDVYEKDIRFIKLGQDVSVTTEAYPHESFAGRVTFIDPVLSADTRTVRVRTEFANRDGRLKPNMFIKARIEIPSSHALVVPASSVLATGRRNIVWVEVQPNTFEPRDVAIGSTTETYAEVLSGVKTGERVAETGGFLIDSESALRQPAGPGQHAEHMGKQPPAQEPFARPSEYFKTSEKHAEHNEAGILVKGRYNPEVIHVKVGEPVALHFYRDEDADCTNEVVFESLGIRRRLPARETTTIVFTPKDTGEIAFSCGMGMVRGKLIVEK